MNLRDFGLEPVELRDDYRPTTIAVVGTSMDSGKTQTAVYLCRGLIAAGLRVGYAKVTGNTVGAKSTSVIVPVEHAPVDPGLLERFVNNPDYHRILELLGYEADTT